jgi:hypothetical protein
MRQHPDTKETAVTAPTASDRRELDHRHANGIDVTLAWSPSTDTLFVTVLDESGDPFELIVEPHEALDAFHHPFAYAAFRGLDLVHVAA